MKEKMMKEWWAERKKKIDVKSKCRKRERRLRKKVREKDKMKK